MAKFSVDAVLDGLLDQIAAATIMCVCSAQPSSYADMTTGVDLATHVMAAGDFAKADHTSGRKLTVAQQAAITVDHSGTATHIAFGISGTSTLLCATTCTSQALTSGNTVTVPAFIFSVADPT